jgi:hypothetical protein
VGVSIDGLEVWRVQAHKTLVLISTHNMSKVETLKLPADFVVDTLLPSSFPRSRSEVQVMCLLRLGWLSSAVVCCIVVLCRRDVIWYLAAVCAGSAGCGIRCMSCACSRSLHVAPVVLRCAALGLLASSVVFWGCYDCGAPRFLSVMAPTCSSNVIGMYICEDVLYGKMRSHQHLIFGVGFLFYFM